MKRIFVDMDGVLADVYAQFIAYEKRNGGQMIDLDTAIAMGGEKAFPNVMNYLSEPGFFRTLPLIEGCVEVMEYLYSKYDLFILSAAMEFPNSLREKYDWLSEHFPFIKWEKIVFCGDKSFVSGDVLIDDYPRNLDPFQGTKILFTQPHNKFLNDEGYTRVNSWAEIRNIL